jgi:hypothetical protein
MLPVSNDYVGVIVSAELSETNGKVGAVVIVRPDGSPETARWYGSFSETVISGGRNEGKMVGECTAATLGEFGVTDFSKIAELVGKSCAFGVKHKPGENGRTYVEVNFIRPPRPQRPVTPAGLSGLNRFRGAALEASRAAPKPAPRPAAADSGSSRGGYDDTDYSGAGDDDIPF